MKLEALLDASAVARHLTAGGLSGEAVARLTGRFLRVAKTLGEQVPADRPVHAFFVPGRIEVLGKHTDYAGGSSLVCAVERGFCLIASPGADRTLHVNDAEMGAAFASVLDEDLTRAAGHWSSYVMTVARRVARNFPGTLRGGHIAFVNDLPRAAGMSSSSALMIAIFLALRALNDLSAHPAYQKNIKGKEDLAQYLGCIENGQTFGSLEGDAGVGTFGGSQDHTAILCSKPGRLSHYAYAPTRFVASLPVPEGYVFAIGASGVAAKKTGTAQVGYNRVSSLAAHAAQAWRTATGRTDPHLGAAIASPAFSSDRMQAVLRAYADPTFSSDALIDRFTHFFVENNGLLSAVAEALRSGEMSTFGALVDRSQEAAERLLKNQIPETNFLARTARTLGAVAASAFGAGFGGSVWALVEAGRVEAFLADWSARYAEAFPVPARRATFFSEQAGPAAFELGRQ